MKTGTGEDEAKMDPQNDRKFGHIAVGVDDIYGVCKTLQDMGYAILRPPRDVSQVVASVSCTAAGAFCCAFAHHRL